MGARARPDFAEVGGPSPWASDFPAGWVSRSMSTGNASSTLCERVVEEGRHQRAGRPVLGRKAILSQDPHDEPLTHDRSPAPAVHAATKAIRIMLRVAYWQFAAAYREAALRLRRGDRLVRFPPGAFPPAMPCPMPGG